VLWIAVVPAVTVMLGLAVATLADRLGSQGEKWTKSVIFLPLAVSGVGAATIWRSSTRPAPPASPRSAS
jgi:alpha-glucoside transport system permease protein